MSAAEIMPAVLVAVPAAILACQAGAALLRRFGQPPVIGEIAMGILLGPSLLGWLWPEAQTWLFPEPVLPYTSVLGQIGLLGFMFLVGLELDLGTLRGSSRTAVAVSQAGILVPLGLGALLAFPLFGRLAPDGVGFLPFALFVAVAMSVTAFPVLARILVDRGLYGTPLGALAMACAAVDDVAAWCLLALVVALTAAGSPFDAVSAAGLTVAFGAAMLLVVRPLLSRWAARGRADRANDGVVLVLLFSGLCLSALATDLIGVHTLFGAFLFGVAAPRGHRRIEASAARLRAVVVPVLLPLFFVHTGLSTEIGVLAADPAQWLWAGALLAVAVLGKWGGAAAAARLCGRSWREATAIGALMNCRGLTELVVLTIGLELGVIGPDLFTMLVLVALITTAVTAPVVSRLQRGRQQAPAQPAATPTAEAAAPSG
ncbi:cation:proton antiporter domain-containing protein [Streptomyces sp. WMMC940]|uniref:cation:proton antiporter domain-containing protein n=1 Tax=Streptomyces sp. WMMC940 TaxID=3015153 RepID=UPI0022B622D5|nr:cation:proton antiporter [Streptomyces sp. WMMC940]MCZ7461765.1 cation:proton antiporter [Streptomyces sp. WMMC940]